MIRFAVVGTNWITEELIKAARETEEFALTAVYSRTEEKAKEFAAKHDIPYLFTDLEKLAQSDKFDAVYIASPNSFHAQQAILCMNYGKHVLCEKPIASNMNELQAMIVAAKKNNVLLMEALKSTLLPNFRAIQENLHKIGQVRRYFASYCQYSSRYDAYKKGTVLNAFNPVFSNGSLMDLGVYCIYPMAVLFGKPEQIKATGIMLGSGVDGEGSILLKYQEMDAVIMHSKITSSYLPSEIQGENGTIIIDKINQPEKVEIRYRDGSVEEITQPQGSQSMYYEVKEFIDLLKSGRVESSTNSYANSMTAVEIMDEARRQIGLKFPADSA
ncbi:MULTISPECIES: Gfo/Idh/MocA family oxidoreductase [unclassified Paenibacillus]|uniref:Gfo/Idh/MocA family protein n=1 Tax=unclassified Paenibacillus TaxID=185978 RepID=UPI001AEB0368|nr:MULTISPECIES: Gfo/Idh/MocA family oxidoreductase [unclassified Paenibacillus]MBP1154173.1 putative dehydrogenase [Paenibacillus sp. PvP091]MBP1170442.1 putative dehydrogenase [Paenibacillus sp. PvR098]MBP2441470.1 putative dehydrogenase [Paenibacillus sp. PvP052]